jgi:hypothetical protein
MKGGTLMMFASMWLYPMPLTMSGKNVVKAYTGIVAHMFCHGSVLPDQSW